MEKGFFILQSQSKLVMRNKLRSSVSHERISLTRELMRFWQNMAVPVAAKDLSAS